ncbi:hypothetical protein GCM10010284_45990 [Streptomyces rubiginosohelvolus]|uniref:Uncharacterized protein n=1 Tax=Streptomyces rubiginosohelvolus TaxID=67362 RepID=A0ABQ3BYB3_9ACTN|nr:hypothetical protein GCM10010284_45990 [Streptomyces rubiginosohelvolus]GGZ58010.1 hypothetical protein GCM10010328_35810 [Streptomyces pluricolorescens]
MSTVGPSPGGAIALLRFWYFRAYVRHVTTAWPVCHEVRPGRVVGLYDAARPQGVGDGPNGPARSGVLSGLRRR